MTVGAATERRILLGLAVFAIIWAIVRAHVQAVTIDESVSYMNFVLPLKPAFWTAHANNHVLHSILAWGFTKIFGASPLAVRSGALIGAALFILASYFLCALIDQSFFLRVSLFTCLVFNPLIFDFLVAARGYGLASGFLLCAICLVAYVKRPESSANARSTVRACVLASVCVALSFVSSFSFAFVDAASIAVLYSWASAASSLRTRVRLAAACFLPGLLVAGALAGPVLLQWNRAELNYGADSLSDTFQTLYEASFYELTPSLNGLISADVPGIILALFGVFAVWRAALIVINRHPLQKARSRWYLVFALVPLVAGAAALAIHWMVFRFAGVPLPQDRTGIYIVFLGTLFLGTLAAVPISTRAGEVSRRGLTILMAVMGAYFLLCLRVSYFKEWRFDSDVDKIYSVLAYYNHTCGLKDIAVNWRYDGSLNYYRVSSGRETIFVFNPTPPLQTYPAAKRAYVVYQPEDRDFLANNALTVVYQAPSGAAIALDPQITPAGESTCPVTLPDQSK